MVTGQGHQLLQGHSGGRDGQTGPHHGHRVLVEPGLVAHRYRLEQTVVAQKGDEALRDASPVGYLAPCEAAG